MSSGIVREDRLHQNLSTTGSGPLALVSEIVARYSITPLEESIRTCRSALERDGMSLAVLGRFKAGKSSFLNHFIGRDVLPVGVIPITSVVTEMDWAAEESAEVRFLDGRVQRVEVTQLGKYVTETNNPQNVKRVSGVSLHLPDLERYRGLRFVDTPGLESAFIHNSGTSLGWAPNTDLALVAVGVDPPLTQQDIILIRKLFEYTPRVCVLLTKVDVLTKAEAAEVLDFVRGQLGRHFEQNIAVFPYSTRPAFEFLKSDLKKQFIGPMMTTLRAQRQAITTHKLRVLLRECGDYLQLAVRSAEARDNEQQELRLRALAGRESWGDIKLELELVARHNAGAARGHIEKILTAYEKEIAWQISQALQHEYSSWRMPFAPLLEHFEGWLGDALKLHLSRISATREQDFRQAVRDVQRQYLKILQGFRDRLSSRAMELLGVPLRTTETEIAPRPPGPPDVKIGRIFDHNWELLSPVVPMPLVAGAVKARFQKIIAYETFKSLSRVTTQWSGSVAATIMDMQSEAFSRLEQLIQTVERLTAHSADRRAEIASDLERVRQAQNSISNQEHRSISD